MTNSKSREKLREGILSAIQGEDRDLRYCTCLFDEGAIFDPGRGEYGDHVLHGDQVEGLIDFFSQELEKRVEKRLKNDYVQKESAEYHRQEMMKLGASIARLRLNDLVKGQDNANGVIGRYIYHKSMYEQLTSQTKENSDDKQSS